MNAIIKRILLFNKTGDKRELSLDYGLNIITGDSKTGKSAILEIIDYCLFSSRSTIPKGIINDFTELFAIVLQISDKYICIGRPNWNSSNGSRIYLRIETSLEFLADITYSYFTSVQEKLLKVAQEEVERHLGLAVLDTRTDNEEDRRNASKVTMRSMVSLLFQHQNLIANKHSLFYRFDDFNKRKKTISDYPILIGWESVEYFLLYRELEEKKKELKVEEKLIEKMRISDTELTKNIYELIKYYYQFIGLELASDLTLQHLKQLYITLPPLKLNSHGNIKIKAQIDEKVDERFKLQEVLLDKELILRELIKTNLMSHDYSKRLQLLNNANEDILDGETHCPVCNNHVQSIQDSLAVVKESKVRLIDELSKIGSYSSDSSEQIESLRRERDRLKRQIGKISVDIKNMEEQEKDFRDKKSLTEISFTLKGATESNIKQLLKQNQLTETSPDLDKLRERVKWLKNKIDGFDLESKMQDSESFLSQRMTEICDSLDFESELKPGKLRFSLSDFTFYYHFKERDKIFLSEMGSGANWLACHLSIFISLLHLSCKSPNSSIPSFLILDQPSQVYFPREYRVQEEGVAVDENIAQVKNIFTVLEEQIKVIKDDCGFEPQIIVMDHADEPEFGKFVKARWKRGGEKLV